MIELTELFNEKIGELGQCENTSPMGVAVSWALCFSRLERRAPTSTPFF
jgi:hypothetical protein